MYSLLIPNCPTALRGSFLPAVICKISALEKLCVFSFSGKIIIKVTMYSLHNDAPLPVNGLNYIRNAVFLQSVFKPQGNLSVS